MNPWRKIYPYSNQIYEAQPYLYIISGMATMLWFRNLAAVASGLVFIVAAIIVWYWRYQYRRAFAQSHGRIEIPTIFRDEAPVPGLVELAWKDAFHCGHPVIDAQHRRLFGLCNVLIKMIVNDVSKLEIEQELSGLVEHVNDHFCAEEAILASTNNPLSTDHQQRHSALLEKVKSLRDRYSLNDVAGQDVVRFVAYEVIAGHILKEDLKWAMVARLRNELP